MGIASQQEDAGARRQTERGADEGFETFRPAFFAQVQGQGAEQRGAECREL